MGLELATQESRSTDWVSQPGSLPTIWFWLAFPLWLMMLMIFSCPYWSFVGPLWRNVYSNLLLIFKLGYFSFYQDTCSLYILYTRSLIRNVICKKKKKKRFLFCGFYFHFYWWCPLMQIFQFWLCPVYVIFVVVVYALVLYPRNFCRSKVMKVYSCFPSKNLNSFRFYI